MHERLLKRVIDYTIYLTFFAILHLTLAAYMRSHPATPDLSRSLHILAHLLTPNLDFYFRILLRH